MSDDPTPLTLPTHLPFPLTITRLFPSSSTTLVRGDKLLEYTFTSDTSRRALSRIAAGKPAGSEDGEPRENDMVGSWECPIDGEMVRWGEGVKVGMKIEKRHASRPVVYVQQACTHPVQLHGLCGICGKELTENDYITPRSATNNQAGPSRFPGAYEMGHDSLGVTVSSNEAKRLDYQTRQNLLRSRRLSLIVDLDQTIIHTTVDPTVGEWLNEIRASTSEEGQSGSKKRWGKNPNVVALEDVATFQLEDDLPPGAVRGRRKAMDRWYYTKPRPGLPAFLEAMSELYEMHVYTMGTRTYANAICAAIDPGGKIFGGRILSRDESGSFSSKNLKRLFPTDQSMVVVIDDRSDVWGDIPNLVKVVPYDFFLGIGDINSNLPSARQNKISSAPAPAKPSSPSSTISDASTPPPMTPPESGSEDVSISKEEMMDMVQEERPLKKLQERLEREQAEMDSSELRRGKGGIDGERDSDRTVSEVSRKVDGDNAASEENAEGSTKGAEGPTEPSNEEVQRSTTPEGSPPPKIPLLNPNDDELDRVQKILTEIHQSFYDAYDGRSSNSIDDGLPMGCDVELIIPDLKSRVLEGCNIAFSGLIPRHIRSEQSDIWQLAETFGARPIHTADSTMTHCVTANLGTEKTHLAQQMGRWVVKLEWLLKSVALWKRADEREYDWFAGGQSRKDDGAVKKGEVGGDGGALGMTLANQDGIADGLGKITEEIPPESKLEDAAAGSQGEAGFEDPDFDLGGWDEEAEKEFEAFLEGSEDGGSEAGGTRSPTSSVTGTPRKRVRYADEEDLPLESHRDPVKRLSFDMAEEEESSRKRKRPILLGPPDDDEGKVTRVQLSEKQQEAMKRQIQEAGQGGQEEEQEERSEAGTEEDEFAKLLAESLDE